MRIVYTRPDGGVSVCTPTKWIISVLGSGGLWSDLPRGFMDKQIASMVARGVNERAAYRYAKSVVLGGCTTAEALEIIRDRDCGHLGTGHELWDNIPDLWFFDAWRRSHNGGPISINMEKAKPIQMKHIADAIAEKNKASLLELNAPVEIDLARLKQKIAGARDEAELRRIWPEEL